MAIKPLGTAGLSLLSDTSGSVDLSTSRPSGTALLDPTADANRAWPKANCSGANAGVASARASWKAGSCAHTPGRDAKGKKLFVNKPGHRPKRDQRAGTMRNS